MAKSQNGYSANDRSVIGTYQIPGGRITIRKGDVSVVLLYVIHRFHNEVERLQWPGNWGYAERPIRGSKTTSNHASGTGIDVNAPKHPLGKVNTFNPAQRAAIRRILDFCEGVVRWGGDYKGRKDDMHFEINAGAAAVARIADKIRRAGGNPPEQGAPAPTGRRASDDIKWIQSRLTYWGFPTVVDGIPGPATTKAIKLFQTSKRLVSDGLVGAKTRAALSANKQTSGTQYHSIPMGGISNLYAEGEQCRLDQASLNNTGFPCKADGQFGPASVKAAKAFQAAAGLTTDGAIGPSSRACLRKVPAWRNQGPREFQQALKNRGWNIAVDGQWGPKSIETLRKFQAEKRLVADGVRGPATWTALHTRGR